METCEVCSVQEATTMIDLNTDEEYQAVMWHVCGDCTELFIGEFEPDDNFGLY